MSLWWMTVNADFKKRLSLLKAVDGDFTGRRNWRVIQRALLYHRLCIACLPGRLGKVFVISKIHGTQFLQRRTHVRSFQVGGATSRKSGELTASFWGLWAGKNLKPPSFETELQTHTQKDTQLRIINTRTQRWGKNTRHKRQYVKRRQPHRRTTTTGANDFTMSAELMNYIKICTPLTMNATSTVCSLNNAAMYIIIQ